MPATGQVEPPVLDDLPNQAEPPVLEALLFQEAPSEPEQAPQFVIPEDPTRQWLDAIDRIEEEFGPYDTELSELYLGLGEAFLHAGEYEEARDAYHRGVMVMRVNTGPNSPEQTGLLYLIANIETVLENPDQANAIIENIQFINTQYYGEGSPELLPVYQRMHHWYQTVQPLDVDVSEYQDYRRIIDMTEEMIALNEAAHGPQSPQTATAYRHFAEAHFQALRFDMNREDWVDPRIVVGMDTPFRSEPGYSETSPRRHYIEGRRAFMTYLDMMETDRSKSPLDYANALADLGDWSLLFEKFRAARRLYEQAQQVLANNPEFADLANGYLAQPKPMYFTNTLPPPVAGATLEPDTMSIDVSMTVTRAGSVRYVEILNPPEDLTEDDLRDIERELRDTPFRPRVVGGKTVTTEQFIWPYVIRTATPAAAPTEERTS